MAKRMIGVKKIHAAVRNSRLFENIFSHSDNLLSFQKLNENVIPIAKPNHALVEPNTEVNEKLLLFRKK